MIINSISFGHKIPIAQCSIKDTENNKNIPAIVYEYDCKSSSDIDDIFRSGIDWNYNVSIAADMQDKYEQVNFKEEESPFHFYVMESQNGKKVALCETRETDKDIKVEYIETKRDGEQKYCGKTMLATLGKKVLDYNKNSLMIIAPLPDVLDFYINGCGFNDYPNIYELNMEQNQIRDFISKTEAQSGGKIIDIKA